MFSISLMNWLFCCVYLGEINHTIVACQRCFAQISRLIMYTWFRCFGPEFQLPWLMASKMCLVTNFLWKPQAPRFKWVSLVETFHTCPRSSLPEEKKPILCGLGWGRASEAYAGSLWTLSIHIFFSCYFHSSAMINLSQEYKPAIEVWFFLLDHWS